MPRGRGITKKDKHCKGRFPKIPGISEAAVEGEGWEEKIPDQNNNKAKGNVIS